MPVKHIVYGCQFKCGWKHSKSFKKIEKHEKDCWHNPLNKTCITCEHGKIVYDYCDHPELSGNYREDLSYRECSVNEKMEFDGLKPITNCVNWLERGELNE